MPYFGPGFSHKATATKAVFHGDPSIEDNHAGIAHKTLQLGRFVDPSTDAATKVAIGEDFQIGVTGKRRVRAAAFSGGVLPDVGEQLYIIEASNLLTPTAGSNVPFGTVDTVDATHARINLNLRVF